MSKTKIWQERLRVSAMLMLQPGCVQRDLRNVFGDTIGQKLYCLCVLNIRFPELKILEFDEKLIAKIRGADLPNLVTRSDPKSLEEYNQRARAANRSVMISLTEIDLANYFNLTPEPKKQQGTIEIMLRKDEIITPLNIDLNKINLESETDIRSLIVKLKQAVNNL